MDKDLQKILDKANNEKKPEKVETFKKFPPSKPYDYLVFTKLTRFSGYQKLVFFVILPGGISTLFFFKDMASMAIACLVIYGVLLLTYTLINYFRFLKFKGWQERLPFSLEGFSEMIRSKKMFCDLCWNDTKITVETNEGNETVQVIEAALKIFVKRTEMAFYTRDAFDGGSRSRRDWKLTSATSVEGSANPEVMRYMKDLFEGELTTIARKTNAISKVNVELLSSEFEVKIQIERGE